MKKLILIFSLFIPVSSIICMEEEKPKNLAEQTWKNICTTKLNILSDSWKDLYNSKPNEQLWRAIRKNNPEGVKTALKENANPNHKNEAGFTPLITVVQSHQEKIGLILLQYKANPNITCKGYAPLHIAVADSSNGSILEMLVSYGADPDLQNSDGDTPLHIATIAGNPNCVKKLLELNANPDLQNGEGNTALHLAFADSNPNERIIKSLAFRTTLTIENNQRKKAFDLANRKIKEIILAKLLKKSNNIKNNPSLSWRENPLYIKPTNH